MVICCRDASIGEGGASCSTCEPSEVWDVVGGGNAERERPRSTCGQSSGAFGILCRGPPMDELAKTIYDELRGLARRRRARQPAGHTLQPSALANEAWVKLRGGFDGRAVRSPKFLGTAAEAMRQILVDHARGRLRLGADFADQQHARE